MSAILYAQLRHSQDNSNAVARALCALAQQQKNLIFFSYLSQCRP